MEFRVLGQLSADVNGVSIVPTAGKPQQLLALLALYPNQVLALPRLMEEIWGTDLPRSALTTLQTYILQLRRRLNGALGAGAPRSAKDVLATHRCGYMLQVEPSSVDVYRYEELVVAGHRAFAANSDAAAADLYRRALELWRGPAMVDVRVGPVLEIEVMRLEASRLAVLERRIEADLRLGRHAELLTELTMLTARHSLHEGLHAQYMVALYRSGQAWRALDVYQSLRTRLIDELGLEPSARLGRLHQGVLAADPSLDSPHLSVPVLDLFAA